MADEINYQGNWDIPVDPDTDAVGDRGYGNEGLDHDVLPDSYQGDNDSETEDGQHTDENMADIDDGMAHTHLVNYEKDADYDSSHSDDLPEWRELGYDLPEGY